MMSSTHPVVLVVAACWYLETAVVALAAIAQLGIAQLVEWLDGKRLLLQKALELIHVNSSGAFQGGNTEGNRMTLVLGREDMHRQQQQCL
jgi:hypothetical protein